MASRYLYLLLFVTLLTWAQGHAQSAKRTITGTVTTEGVQLEGVLVLIKGSDYFSGTQQDGVFYIPVSASDSVLVFSLAGYQSKEVTLSDKSEYSVELKKKSPSIHEQQWYADTTILWPFRNPSATLSH